METPWSTAEQMLTDKTGIVKRNIKTRQAQDLTGETDFESQKEIRLESKQTAKSLYNS